MGWNREQELMPDWELWSRGDLDSCKIVNTSTKIEIWLPGETLKRLARSYLEDIIERVIEELPGAHEETPGQK